MRTAIQGSIEIRSGPVRMGTATLCRVNRIMFALRIPIPGAFHNFALVHPITQSGRTWVAGQGEDSAVREEAVEVAEVEGVVAKNRQP